MPNPFSYHIVRYGLVGLCNVAIDYLALNGAYLYLHLSLFLSVLVGFLIANTFGYLMHSRWTFRYDASGKEVKKLSHFLFVGAISLTITEVIVRVLTADANIHYNLAKAISVVVSALWAYAAMRWWVFAKA